MTGRLTGKTAVITGAARGIGRAQAVRFAEEGAAIIAIDVCGPIESVQVPPSAPQDLAETARLVEQAGGRIVTEIVDVRSPDELHDVVDRGATEFDGIDIVCATAGITSRGAAIELSEAAWRTMLDINLTGVWNTCAATAPHLIKRGAGSMVLISSIAGLRGLAGVGHYTAATQMNLLAVPWVQPVDIANASLFLASDEARYVTAISLPVDAGSTQR